MGKGVRPGSVESNDLRNQVEDKNVVGNTLGTCEGLRHEAINRSSKPYESGCSVQGAPPVIVNSNLVFHLQYSWAWVRGASPRQQELFT